MADQQRSVGLVVTTVLPDGRDVAVLQIRGEINPDKLPQSIDESFPGGCQVTVHGRLKDCERTDDEALIRETEEELGADAARSVRDCIQYKRLLTQRDDPAKPVATYHLALPVDFLKQVRLGPSSGGLRLVTADEARNINALNRTDTVHGVMTRIYQTSAPFACLGKLTAMFPDERKAVQRALGIFLT